jgi:hypothetical protein
MLTEGEYVSWIIQGIIRRWLFLGIITIVTILAWTTNNSTVLTWWNLGASYLAIVIESIVGLGMYSQTKRDAVCIREIRAISQHVEKLAEALLADVTTIEEEVKQLEPVSPESASLPLPPLQEHA